MIAIVNIDESDSPYGVHKYSLRINREELCQFYHNREDSLDICLEKASKAYKQAFLNSNNLINTILQDIEKTLL